MDDPSLVWYLINKANTKTLLSSVIHKLKPFDKFYRICIDRDNIYLASESDINIYNKDPQRFRNFVVYAVPANSITDQKVRRALDKFIAPFNLREG